MQLPDIVIFALAEGVADILPVDAGGHALIVAKLLGWRAGTIAAAIHLGAAVALLCYLWRDVLFIGQGLWKLRRGRIEPGTRLLGKALLAAAPWLIVTAFLGPAPVPGLNNLALVGAITVLCALLMGLVDRLCMTVKRTEHLGAVTALAVGVAQLLALVPGVGRIAAALTATRLLGLERPDAYRFVLLTNIPILLADGIALGVRYALEGLRPAASDVLMFGATWFLVLLVLPLAVAWVRRLGLLPFAVYRLAIGAGLIALGVL